jgi:Bacterial type II and III secretion system protein
MRNALTILILILALGTWRIAAQEPARPESPTPTAAPEEKPVPTPPPEAQPPPPAAPETSPPPNPLDRMERQLQQREEAEQPPVPTGNPNTPGTHRYTNQPLSRVLRTLAELAQINYVEPYFNRDEPISVVLQNMTPLQAFYAVAAARKFKVVQESEANVITLTRADIITPEAYETRTYMLKYETAEDLLQAVAGFLGIQVRPAGESPPAYPRPNNIQGGAAAYAGAPEVTGGAAGGVQTLYSAGTEQSAPRFVSGLPFDSPLSVGGFGQDKQEAVSIGRSSNSLTVRATPEEHEALARQLRIWDRPEDQIQINTYVVEVSNTDDLFGGVDWSNTLGQNGSTFTLTGNVGSPPNTIFSQTVAGAFFKSGLILTFPTVQATIRALTQRGKLKSTNSPVTYTRTGEPVQIRSVTQQTIFLQTAATANVQATTTPYTFTTGLTIDVVPRILRGGILDLKINPALSTQTGTSPAQPGTNTTVPIISTRSATADVQVRSGDAAVIGGITEDTDNYLINGVPGLRKIPLLGYLFYTRQKNRDRTNLVIIVWPKIIKGSFKRTDRVGADEVSSVENLSDLPGEPPPIPYGTEGKQPTGKRAVYFQQGQKGSRKATTTTQ